MNHLLRINRCVSLLMLLTITVGLAACSKQESAAPEEPTDDLIDVSIVNYMEREAGTDPYPVRIIISAAYVRLDDGYDESDFVLLDRASHTLYSVAHENHSVLVIDSQQSDAGLPDDIILTEERTIDDDAPMISGKRPVHTRYLANEAACFEAVSVEGIMGAAVTGMKEFAAVLGDRQLANMHTVPEIMQTPCFLSRYVYVPGRVYAQGLPVQLWDETGFYRSLVDFTDGARVAPDMFNVPGDYQGLSL